MNYIITENGEIVYLYQLKSGVASSSFAIQIAETKGAHKSITDRATQVTF